MSKIVLYHGSVNIVDKPIYHFSGANCNNDYGLGFYCTRDISLAKEWASKQNTPGFLNKYIIDDSNLNTLDLTDTTKFNVLNWIAILIHYRSFTNKFFNEHKVEFEYLSKYYVDVSSYDVVIGYRADDAYFKFPLLFIDGKLSYDNLKNAYELGKLGKQYVLISEKAFKQIKFISAKQSDYKHALLYKERLNEANRDFEKILSNQDKFKSKMIADFIKEDKQ